MLIAPLYPMVTANATPGPIAVGQHPPYYRRRMKALGTRLRKALEASGLSQSEVARRIGVSSQTINQWLSGKKSPSRANLLKFVEATGARIDAVLYGDQLHDRHVDATVKGHSGRGRFVELVQIASVVSQQPIETTEQVFAHFPCGPRAQAFIVPDDSNAPEYRSGGIWIVDPDETPKPGDMVVAAEGESLRPILGVYRVEVTAAGRVVVVTPINADWPAARSDLGRLDIIAVMTEDIKPRRAR